MAITTPSKPSTFKTMESDFASTIAEAEWKKAARAVNFLDKCFPIGMLMFFHATQASLPATPDTNYWKLMDGSVISNANSVLNGVTTIDLRDKFIRHPITGEALLLSGGADTVNLAHTHGPSLTAADPRVFLDVVEGGVLAKAGVTSHTHTLSSSLGVVSTVPTNLALQIWIRVC